jgi:hypothetical protein
MDDIAKMKFKMANRQKALEEKKSAKLDKIYKKLGMETRAETTARLEWEREEAYKAVSLEKKQKFLDLMAQGKNVGEASDEVGIDSMIGAQIIIRNADTISLWPTKAKV